MKQVLINRDHYYELVSDESGMLYLSVLCGTIALYEVIIPLNDEETASYASQGESFLTELARQVSQHESQFKDRFVLERTPPIHE